MKTKDAVKYLEKVLERWSCFTASHRKFKEAIEILLKEVNKNE